MVSIDYLDPKTVPLQEKSETVANSVILELLDSLCVCTTEVPNEEK